MNVSLHTVTFPDIHSKKYNEARYHFLLHIIFGETIAIDYCKKMATFAPNEKAKEFLLQQQEEEEKHLEMLTSYIIETPREYTPISVWLKKIDYYMVQAIENKDYVMSLFIQNFIIEGLNVSLLKELIHHADGTLSELLGNIIKDEERHALFGVSEMKRLITEEKIEAALLARVMVMQRKVLLFSIGLAFSLLGKARYVGIPGKEFGLYTIRDYEERIKASGIKLFFIDKVLFFVAKTVFRYV